MKYGSSNSKYCYQGTDILINKLDIRTDDLLKEAESLFTAQRLLELSATPFQGSFDLKHLQQIHYYMFQDLYDFAGKIREEDISKGNTLFAKFQYIAQNTEMLFNELKSEKLLKETSVDEFSKRSAYYMSELNIIHPFREGNGRTIREFIRCLALSCGYILNWNSVDKDNLLDASIKSVNNYEHLARCIRKSIV